MQLILLHKDNQGGESYGSCLLRQIFRTECISDIVLKEMKDRLKSQSAVQAAVAIPEDWDVPFAGKYKDVMTYDNNLSIPVSMRRFDRRICWFTISNGRFITSFDWQKVHARLAYLLADIVSLEAEPELTSQHERPRFTSNGELAGLRRLYTDVLFPDAVPLRWPHHLFIRSACFDRLLTEGSFPSGYDDFIARCRNLSLEIVGFRIGGAVCDLRTEADALEFLIKAVDSANNHVSYGSSAERASGESETCRISDSARIFGKVLLGKNVCIDNDAAVIGPAIICDGVKVESEAIIRRSIIGCNLSILKGEVIDERIVLDGNLSNKHEGFPGALAKDDSGCLNGCNEHVNSYRTWPGFSYARFFKRFADILISSVVLFLSVPVFLAVAAAVKLNSPGPVFFRHKRQGLHGRDFYCLKFRTMIAGADEMQDRLRFGNKVDGPQFKMDKDPRITMVGKFLRETFIDEIPQFINIFLGDMSVVGPRPSPRSENLLCPSWRDARLSLRPGITGLWQVYRTRKPGRDFQEWIYYDIKYVEEISLWQDIVIGVKTAGKIIVSFIKQF